MTRWKAVAGCAARGNLGRTRGKPQEAENNDPRKPSKKGRRRVERFLVLSLFRVS